MATIYDKTIRCRGNTIRIISEIGGARLYHNGSIVADRLSDDTGTMVFQVAEDGATVTYDVLILKSETVSCFIGRNGDLLFSDAPGFSIDLTDAAGG